MIRTPAKAQIMSAKSTWAATAAGTAVGTGGWIFGLGKHLWPAHPLWVLFFLTIAVTTFTKIGVEREDRRRASQDPRLPPPA